MLFAEFFQLKGISRLFPEGLTTVYTNEQTFQSEKAVLKAQLEGTATANRPSVNGGEHHLGVEKSDSDDEETRNKEIQDGELRRELQELLVLQNMLAYLLQSHRLQEAEVAVCCFIDRNPRNADGFVLLADIYTQEKRFASVCECLWGAIHNSPGNRMLLRLLRDSEEQSLLQLCELPVSFLAKSLATYQPLNSHRSGSMEFSDSIFSVETAPVVVVRQGTHVAAMANRDLEPGEIVFRQRPFVLTPLMLESGQIYTSCFHCLQDREDPSRGYSCPVKPYTCPFAFCSWECLMRNSRIHALECQAIPLLLAAAKESKLSSTTVLHIFRTIVKTGLERQNRQDQGDERDKGENATTDVVEQLLQLNSYRAAVIRGQPELYAQLTLLARRLQRVLPAHLLLFLEERELIELMLILWQYSTFLTSPSIASAVDGRNPDGAIGQVLAPAVALLHHSCVPTCVVCLQEDGLVAVRALSFIPSGGSLCISLEEDLFKPQKERKGVTASPRIFGCGCIRCTDSAEGGRLLRGIRCFKCVRGFLSPHKSKSLASRLNAYTAALSTVPMPENPFEKGQVRKANSLTAQQEAETSESRRRETRPADSQSPQAAGEKGTLEGDASLDEEWLCANCGLTSAYVNRSCAVLEREVEQLQAAAERRLVSGARLEARKLYTALAQRYSSQLHPQHAVLFNTHTILAGLLASQPAKDPIKVRLRHPTPYPTPSLWPLWLSDRLMPRCLCKALIYIRRAALAAETVLPPCSRLKMDLNVRLSDLTYQAMSLNQHCRRGPALPAHFLMSPLYAALWNCSVCFGNDSSLAIVLQQKLRRYAALLNVSTPPLLHQPVLKTVDVFVGLYRQVTGCRTSSEENIAQHFAADPMFFASALVRGGFCFPLSLQVFLAMKDVPHLPTGLTLLGLACLHRQVAIVRELLKMGFDLFHETALGVTALLAMAGSGTKPYEFSPEALGMHENLIAVQQMTSAEDAASGREAAILRHLLQRCELLERKEVAATSWPGLKSPKRSPHRPERSSAAADASLDGGEPVALSHRSRLLNATTHKLLGRSSALHLAASQGKEQLCKQLLAAGALIAALNSEAATALHLACSSGHVATVQALLDCRAPVDATTLRGETPLMLAAYNLHTEICRLLLKHGADPDQVSRAEGFSVLHAVSTGVTRQATHYFRGLAWEGDRACAALSGLSVQSKHLGFYVKDSTYISQETLVDVRLPAACPESSELFFFPKTMLERTRKAQEILLLLTRHCTYDMYRLQSNRGFAPADLLLSTWDAFVTRKERLLQVNDLQLEGQTREEAKATNEGWQFVLHQIFVIRDMLKPELLPQGPSTRMHQRFDTPRPEELQQRNKEKMVGDAPWLFSELIASGATRPSHKPPMHQKHLVTRDTDALKTAPKSSKEATGGTGFQLSSKVTGAAKPSQQHPAPHAKEKPSPAADKKAPPDSKSNLSPDAAASTQIHGPLQCQKAHPRQSRDPLPRGERGLRKR
ncbi:ankyrin repeat-containing protein [Cyclospora cayetanensis]|uniref:Ankyrin repeat-containing protein n=1 Tax=Cyclospora cayetanensis TaxID=88456 RepID=A0A1D3CYB3_9EIME|nr:ankyrin repeat-containing protein [Cyclospora cayetanensis]